MISRELAQKLIERISQYTDYNVNIMDEDGIIIASRDRERLGQYHEIAYRIVHGSEDHIDLYGTPAFPNVKPGINMVIATGGRREGVVGVTGDPEEIRPVALITKMAIETMLKYERQQSEAHLMENRKERFVYMLTQDRNSDPEELRQMADDLGYPEEMPRIPILIYSADVDPEFVIRFLRESANHRRTDFSIVLDNHRTVVFKTVYDKKKRLTFSDCRELITEYLDPFMRWLSQNRSKATFYVGTYQNSYAQYYYSFRHCKWLENNLHVKEGIVFFYDHTGSYLQDLVPTGELQHIFHSFTENLPEKKAALYMELTGALLRNNFNFNKAAEELYVHKNTLVYRYNAMKEYFGIDPVESPADRSFLGALYQYYVRAFVSATQKSQ